jgi:ATP-dependent DNA ligase
MRLVAIANGILFSEAFAAEGTVVFTKACELGLEGIVSKAAASTRAGKPQLAEDDDPEFR